MNEQNLRTPTSEEAREMQKKSVIARKANRTISEGIKDFINTTFKVKTEEGEVKQISGEEYVIGVMKSILARRDSSSVTMIKTMIEATEGQKINLTGEVSTSMQTTEERVKEFEKLL